jgi:hypothetical protein
MIDIKDMERGPKTKKYNKKEKNLNSFFPSSIDLKNVGSYTTKWTETNVQERRILQHV